MTKTLLFQIWHSTETSGHSKAGSTVDVVLASSPVVDVITRQAERLMNGEKRLNLRGVRIQ
jgi:hypothetical protein